MTRLPGFTQTREVCGLSLHMLQQPGCGWLGHVGVAFDTCWAAPSVRTFPVMLVHAEATAAASGSRRQAAHWGWQPSCFACNPTPGNGVCDLLVYRGRWGCVGCYAWGRVWLLFRTHAGRLVYTYIYHMQMRSACVCPTSFHSPALGLGAFQQH